MADFKCDYNEATVVWKRVGFYRIREYEATITHKPSGKSWPGKMIVCPAGSTTRVLDSLGYKPGKHGCVLTPDNIIAGALLDNFKCGEQAVKVAYCPAEDLQLFAPK